MKDEEYYNQDIPLEEGIEVKAFNNRLSFKIKSQTFFIEPNWDGDTELKWYEIQLKKALTNLKFKDGNKLH